MWGREGAIREKHVSGNDDIHYPARAAQGKVIGIAVHIYIYVYMFVDLKKLNCTLAIDSPFQTFVVGFLDRLALPLLSPETLS